MCYTGECQYETYPYGGNESCVCKRPPNSMCYLDMDVEDTFDEKQEEYFDEDD